MISRAASGFAWLAPGCTLDRYELLLPVAEGGMALLWLARQQGKYGFERVVAVKTILPKYASDGGFRRMFLDEAHLASSIDHVNVARILDLGEENGVLFMVMEWIDGESLMNLGRAAQRGGSATVPIGVLTRVAVDTCAGLQAAHVASSADGRPLAIVHRDISPHNLLVGFNGITRIIDFGIAKARNRLTHDTCAGVVKGKVAYMAPEQAMGLEVDVRTDIWGVGSTLYRYLAGRPPYGATDPIAMLRTMMSGTPPDPTPPSVPLPIRHVVDKALQLDPNKRFQTAEEMGAALEAAMGSAQVRTTYADVASLMAQRLGDVRAARVREVEYAVRESRSRQAIVRPGEGDEALTVALTDPIDAARRAARGRHARVTLRDGPLSAETRAGSAHVRPTAASASVRTAYDSRLSTDSDELYTGIATDPDAAARVVPTDAASPLRATSNVIEADATGLGPRALPPGSLACSIPVPRRGRLRRTRLLGPTVLVIVAMAAAAVALSFPFRRERSAAVAGAADRSPVVAVTRPAAVATMSLTKAARDGANSSDSSASRAEDVPKTPPASTIATRSVVPNEPPSAATLLERGRKALRAGRLADAQAAFALAITLDPSNCEALTGMADAEQAQGATALAARDYERAVDVNGRYLPARVGLADALWKLGKRADAQLAYRSIVEDFPADLCPPRARERGEPTPSDPSAPAASTATGPAATVDSAGL